MYKNVNFQKSMVSTRQHHQLAAHFWSRLAAGPLTCHRCAAGRREAEHPEQSCPAARLHQNHRPTTQA
jgi:hypothetical protein